MSGEWTVDRLQAQTTSAAFRNLEAGQWQPERTSLHEQIVNSLLAGKQPKEKPTILIVMGRIGTGRSTFIANQLVPKHGDAAVIDADQLWLKIPEYEALAEQDWRTVGDRTYAEVRYLRDVALAEAAARKLDIILETGAGGSAELVGILTQAGYKVDVSALDCPVEVARERINERANSNPTPEDNLWCSPPRPEFPDKFDYQDVDVETFLREYKKRRAV